MSDAEARFDAFLSYNSADRPVVEALARGLRSANLTVWFDRWNIAVGDDWQDHLAEGLRCSDACVVFVGPHGISDWARQELKVALDRAARRSDFRIVPVLLPGVATPFDPTTELPPFLVIRSWLDLRQGTATTAALESLVQAIKGIAPGPGASTEMTACPYRGLQPFGESDAALFFGRDGDIAQLVESIGSFPFLAVLGPSGSGKSSLVRAGLLPALRRGVLPDSDIWRIVTMRPGPRPLDEVASRLSALGHPHPTTDLRDALATDDRTLGLAGSVLLAASPHATELVWVVDQFEEIFTHVTDPAERDAFVSNLLHAVTRAEPRCRVVLTMRADFYPRCAADAVLARMMAAHQFLVSPLEPDGWRAAIEEPAIRAGLHLQPGLVETIMADSVGRPGSLPLLQEALVATWERRVGDLLTLEGYFASGGVAGALAGQAERLFETFSPEEQTIVRDLFLRLIQVGEGTGDTRRRTSMAALIGDKVGDEDVTVVDGVIRRLTAARLVTTDIDTRGLAMVDMSHEALVAGWPRLRGWIDADRDDLRLRQRLSDHASEWEARGWDESLLYRGTQLRLAVELHQRGRVELVGTEREFLDASQSSHEREEADRKAAEDERVRRAERDRVRRRVTAGLVLGLLVATVLTIVAIVQSREARRQQAIARSLRLAAQSEIIAPRQLDLGLLLALEARSQNDGVEQRGSVLDALARAPGPARYLRPEGPGLGPIGPIAMSSNGSRLVVPMGDGTIGVWDPRSGEHLADLPEEGHGPVTAIAFRSDGVLAAAGHQDGSITVWQVDDGHKVREDAAHGGPVLGVAFAGLGEVVSAARDDPVVTPLDGAQPSRTIQTGGEPVTGVAVTPDGSLLATVSGEAVRRWDLRTGAPLGAALVDGNSDLQPVASAALAWDETGTYLLVNAGSSIVAFPAGGGDDAPVRFPGGATPQALAIGGGAVVSALQQDVLVWDRSDPETQPQALLGHTGTVRFVAASADGNVVVSSSDDGTIIVWNIAPTPPLVSPMLHDVGRTMAVVFSPDGGRIASSDATGAVRLWDASAGHELLSLESPGTVTTRLAFLPDGSRLLGGGFDGGLTLWDPSTGRIIERRAASSGPISALVASPDGRWVAAADREGTLSLWSGGAGTRRELPVTQKTGVSGLAFSADSRLLAASGRDSTVHLWDVDTGREVRVLRGHIGIVGSVAFSPDGRFLASGGDDRTVRLWDPAEGEEIAKLAGHGDLVTSLHFSPDGRRLASAGEDGSIILWDIDRRVAIGSPLVAGIRSFVSDLAQSPSGSALASAQADAVLVWDIDEADWLHMACRIAGRDFTPEERSRYLDGQTPSPACG